MFIIVESPMAQFQTVDIDPAEIIPVRVVSGSSLAPATAVFANKSGTIATGGLAQVLAAANSARVGLFIQNNSTGDLWISSIGTAAAAQPSLWLPPGSYYEFPQGGVPATAVSIYGATTGQAFSAREW